jgi:hypothetical protein
MTSSSREQNTTNRWILKSALVLGLPIILLFAYNYSPVNIQLLGTSLKKIDPVDSLVMSENVALPYDSASPKSSSFPWEKIIEWEKAYLGVDSITVPLASRFISDSLHSSKINMEWRFGTSSDSLRVGLFFRSDTIPFAKTAKSDSSQQRILLLGDSQAGGLVHLFNDYCAENGHQLTATLIWYSASVFNFGFSTKVDDLIKQYHPTLIVIVLGLNELYAKDLDQRYRAASMLRAKLGSTPYLWIGPANFVEDKGINKVYEQTATSERFVVSKNLNLPKGSDKRHPSQEGYKIWMEHIARFIQGSELYNFKFETPKKFGHRMGGRIIQFNAAKDKGY